MKFTESQINKVSKEIRSKMEKEALNNNLTEFQ